MVAQWLSLHICYFLLWWYTFLWILVIGITSSVLSTHTCVRCCPLLSLGLYYFVHCPQMDDHTVSYNLACRVFVDLEKGSNVSLLSCPFIYTWILFSCSKNHEILSAIISVSGVGAKSITAVWCEVVHGGNNIPLKWIWTSKGTCF